MFAKFFIDRPIFAWVIALVIMLCGALAFQKLPITAYPTVAPPAIAVNIIYPGASAQVVEDTAVTLVEQQLNGIEHLLYMESASEQGRGTITLTFEAGTDLDVSSVEAQNRIKRAEPRLPQEVQRAGITVGKAARNYLMFVALISPDKSRDNVALGSYAASSVLDHILRVPGVGEAVLFGTEYSMRLWLDTNKLYAYNLTPADVKRAVAAQNTQLAMGELGQLPAAPGQQLNAVIVTKSRLSSPEEFGNVVIRANPNGSSVRLRDVARIELGAEDYSMAARLDGQPASAIAIRLAPGANALETARAIKDKMAELSKQFPQGIGWEIPYDTSKFVDIAIHEVVMTLGIAMVLVFFVMYLFLGNLRATFIPTIVVPVALTGTVVGLYFLGYSINILTLFAMVLAIGIVVDDAIVVVENVERIMMEEGLPPRAATRKAMDQIFNAIIAISVVLSAVFVPMAFFSGSVGAIYKQFAVTLVLAMAFSVLIALTLTPALCASMMKHEPEKLMPTTGFFGWFNRFFVRNSQRYQSSVRRILGRSGRAMAVYAAILVGMGWLLVQLPTSFLPEEDQGYFFSVIQLPSGATRERAQEVLQQVEAFYLKQPEVEHVIGVMGFSFFGRGQNTAMTFVRLKDWDERTQEGSDAASLVKRANMALFGIKQAMIFSVNVPPIPELAAVGGFDFRLQDRSGQGRDKLMEARNMVLGMASKNPVFAGVRPEGQEPAPQLQMDVNRIKAQALGVDMSELNETLQSALGVAYINDFVRNGRILRVQLQAEAATRATVEQILRLPVRNAKGGMVPLSEICTPHWVVGAPKLDRYNGMPSAKIAGGPAPGHSSGEAMAAMEQIAAQLPPGFGFEWSGTSSEEKLSGNQAPLLFGLSVIAVFLCLAALYESWSIPFAVILVVPIGILGALLAVTLRGLPNDIYFKVGLIVIIGLSAKNAILIIQFARDLQDKGMDLVEATLEACRLRFRPILMTSIAFIFGVLPLAISSGAGSNSRHAIGTGVMGGMLAATALAVFLIPVFFVLMRRYFPEKFHPEAEENPHD
ncbi:Multidrug export protein AcrF [Ferriphaselus amnicola]|uniref:Efflux pump membrane transporter n=1 Tax=Ferriphaselus amnicola TaxID=1188319 RepID=A0A2Z6GEK4_9PROT|nr:efflux RND transporter permease subunit [Ferriphaselus amnicola]BBE51847.1 Multidrug export protein AcrF [Ferriphaselus amnicola]